MMNRIRLALLPLCTFVLTVACGGDSSGPPAVASVDVSAPAGDVAVGQTTQLSATARDAKGNVLSNRTIEWTTSSASIATVSTNGLVTGVAAGQVTITAASGGKTGSRTVNIVPPPVSTVSVTAASNALQVGQTTQLSAVTRDASNNVLAGRNVTWSTSSPAVASVSLNGLVTALAAGSVTLTGTSEGKTGSTDIVVTTGNPADAPQLSAVTPAAIIEGQAATITGSKFSPDPAGNVVRVGGVAALVTAASATSLQIQVPRLNCRPAQNISISVTVAGATSAPRTHPFAPASTFTLAQGKQQIIGNPADFCLQFSASSASESYLIGVQSISESGSSLTPVQFTGEAGASAVSSGAASRTFVAPALPASLIAGLADPRESARALRIARHHAAESQILANDQTVMRPQIRSMASGARAMMNATTASAARVPTVPGSAKVGDVLAIRVPDRAAGNTCANFVQVNATVKAVGTNAIFLEDNANPTGGFSASNYQTLSNTFDGQIHPTDVSYFGAPTDYDANGRTVIVITKEVNKVDNLLGVVYLANFFPECAASNQGEFFYGRAPDPNGAAGKAYTIDDALADVPIIVAHEFAHVIQFGRRLDYEPATSFQTIWELEGQATFAEEVNGYAVTGRAPGQNLGAAVVFNKPQTTPIDWFVAAFVDLVVYYGFESGTSKAPNAPEQCSWLSLKSDGNSGPCLGDYPVYGASWSLLRWISDQYGPTFPGGEKGLHKRLVDNAFTGFATLSDVTGAPIDVLLAQWAAALYTDDRVANLDAKLKFTSWNMKDVEAGIVQTARLTPRDRQFGAFTDQVSVRGGSTAYFLVSGNGRGATGIRARDASDGTLPATMRLWVVRLQ